MSKKYDLTALEVLKYLHQVEDSEFSEPFSGYSEEEIQEAEQRLGVSFPNSYREYMMKYGRHPANNAQDRMVEPSEIGSTYEYLSEELDCYEEDLEGLTEEEKEKKALENVNYRLCMLPKEEWYKITEDYILIAFENQGCWSAGYLRKDLDNGVENPPIYISTEDDFITYKKVADNIQEFLKVIFFMSMWCLDIAYEEEENAWATLKEKGIDTSKMVLEGVHFCLDTENNILYGCDVAKGQLITLLIADPTWNDEEDE